MALSLNPRGVITPCYRCRHWRPTWLWIDRVLFGHAVFGRCAVLKDTTWKTFSCSHWERKKGES